MFELPETSSASQASLPCESVTHDAVVVWRSILLQLVVLGTPSVLVFRMVPIPIGDDVDEGDADSTWHRMAKVIKLVTDPGSDRQALDSGDGSAGGRFEKGTMTLERKLMVPLLLRSSPNVDQTVPTSFNEDRSALFRWRSSGGQEGEWDVLSSVWIDPCRHRTGHCLQHTIPRECMVEVETFGILGEDDCVTMGLDGDLVHFGLTV